VKAKALSLVVVGCLMALAAWLEYLRSPARPPLAAGGEVAEVQESANITYVPEKYRETVSKGLDFLAANQFEGHWEGDEGQHPVAMTGLVGVAFLMGPVDNERWGIPGAASVAHRTKYSAKIDKVVDWLLAKCRRDGLIFSDHPSETDRYMEGHGLATLFLAGVRRNELSGVRHKRLTDVLHRAVKYIVKAQSSQGGWHHTSKAEGHDFATVSATVIQIQALQAAENVGIPVPRETVNDAQAYLRSSLDTKEKGAERRIRPVDVAAALACRSNPTPGSKEEPWEKWFTYCQTEIPVGRDIAFDRDALAHYYYAQGINNLADGHDGVKAFWSVYRTATFDRLQSSQNKDGGWPAVRDGISSGPVYATALWCTILQLDNERHPSVRRIRNIIIR
jgi:hypothetical protein